MTEKTQKTRSHTWLILSLLLAVALIVVGFVFSRILEKSSDIVETNPVTIDAEFYNEDGQKNEVYYDTIDLAGKTSYEPEGGAATFGIL
jgi:hypothetical protein